MKRNIILVGFMGTGKSVTGQLVAKQLKRTFVDMDAVIEERAGRKISEIFATDGEPHFRAMERELVRELSARENLVVATGGGVVLNPDNIADFSRTGLVICLTAKPDVILKRVSGESHRPLLENEDKSKAIRELLARREALYRAIPECIDTSLHTAEDTAAEVLLRFERQATTS